MGSFTSIYNDVILRHILGLEELSVPSGLKVFLAQGTEGLENGVPDQMAFAQGTTGPFAPSCEGYTSNLDEITLSILDGDSNGYAGFVDQACIGTDAGGGVIAYGELNRKTNLYKGDRVIFPYDTVSMTVSEQTASCGFPILTTPAVATPVARTAFISPQTTSVSRVTFSPLTRKAQINALYLAVAKKDFGPATRQAEIIGRAPVTINTSAAIFSIEPSDAAIVRT